MAGTQGSSYSSSSKAAAGNKATTQNLQKGLNASGSAKTSSGLGNKPASSSVNAAAANAARMAASRAATAATQRTQNSSPGGYGRSSPASASVNAAAARAAMMNNQRQAGITQSSPLGKGGFGGLASNAVDKTSLPGIGQTYGKGTNYSAADYAMAGYGAYKNPNATQNMVDGRGNMIASLASPRPNITTVSKGINQSPADLLAGGYGSYRQAPSMQSTPQTAAGGWNDLASMQSTLGQFSPTLGGIVSGLSRSPFAAKVAGAPGGEIGSINLGPNGIPEQQLNNAGYGPAPSQVAQINYGQTPFVKDISRVPQGGTTAVASAPTSYNWNGSPNYAAANAAGLNQAFNVNSMPKVAMEGGIPGAISPDSVPSLPNYGPSISVANREPSPYDAQTQVAGYQNPGRAFPSRSVAPQMATNSPMAGQGVSFSDNRYSMPAAGYNQEIVRALANQRAVSAGLLGNAGTDTFGKYAPSKVAEAPASSSDSGATGDFGIYDQTPTLGQKIKAGAINYLDKKTAGLKSAGNYVNGLLGGSSDGGNVTVDRNARDELNNLPPKEREKVVTEAGKASEDPEFRALSDADKAKVLELIKTGMTLADALKAIKTGTTTTPITRPTYRYPQYYTDWAGLPSGQTYG